MIKVARGSRAYSALPSCAGWRSHAPSSGADIKRHENAAAKIAREIVGKGIIFNSQNRLAKADMLMPCSMAMMDSEPAFMKEEKKIQHHSKDKTVMAFAPGFLVIAKRVRGKRMPGKRMSKNVKSRPDEPRPVAANSTRNAHTFPVNAMPQRT